MPNEMPTQYRSINEKLNNFLREFFPLQGKQGKPGITINNRWDATKVTIFVDMWGTALFDPKEKITDSDIKQRLLIALEEIETQVQETRNQIENKGDQI